jgi:hypothetical protein
MTLEFKRGEGIDQFGREQAAGPEVQAGPGVWEHRIIGLCSSAPGFLPRQGLVFNGALAGTDQGRFAQRLRRVELRHLPHLPRTRRGEARRRSGRHQPGARAQRRHHGRAARSLFCSARRWRGLRRQELRGDHPRRLEADAERSVQSAGAYNRKTDPQEKTNLAATNKKMFNELSAALRLHIQRGGATPWQKPPAGRSP